MAGSEQYVRNGLAKSERIGGVFNFEMVGYYNPQPNSQSMPPGFDLLFPDLYRIAVAKQWRGDFIVAVANTASSPLSAQFATNAATYVPELKAYTLVVPGNGAIAPDLRRSDHASFWDAGWPALMISDTSEFRYPYYHTPQDTMDRLNFEFMANTVKAVVATVAKLAGIQHASVEEAEVIVAPAEMVLQVRVLGDAALLTWPGTPSGATLQSLRKLLGQWSDVTHTPTIDSGTNILRLTPLKSQEFFRLVPR